MPDVSDSRGVLLLKSKTQAVLTDSRADRLLTISRPIVIVSSLLMSCLDEDGGGSISEDEFVVFWNAYSFA